MHLVVIFIAPTFEVLFPVSIRALNVTMGSLTHSIPARRRLGLVDNLRRPGRHKLVGRFLTILVQDMWRKVAKFAELFLLGIPAYPIELCHYVG